MSEPLVSVEGVSVRFPRRRPGSRSEWVTAVQDVSLAMGAGDAYGLVGESGSGKTTLARVLAGLLPASEGRVCIAGEPIDTRRLAARRRLWCRVQFVHQTPRGGLNPRRRVAEIVGGPLESLRGIRGPGRDRAVADALDRVGLPRAAGRRFPNAFSGGEAQLIAIARALVAAPSVLVLDEPTSALDVRVQARILALLASLRRDLGMCLFLISHDLPVVAALCDRIGVMREGRLVEEAPAARLIEAPRQAYTRALLDAVPRLAPRPIRVDPAD